MGPMAKQFYADLGIGGLASMALVFFLIIFGAAVVRTFVLKRRSDFDELSALPLADDTNEVQS